MLQRIVLLLALACPLVAMAAPFPLEEAWRRVAEANPTLRTARAEAATTQATINSLHLSLEHRQRGPSFWDSQREWSVGIAQTLEIVGQPRARREAAQATLLASQAEAVE